MLLLVCAQATSAAERALDAELHRLRIPGAREWTEFPERPEADKLAVEFDAQPNAEEWTLRLRQQDVKQGWKVLLNEKELGQLVRDENDMVVFFAIPPGTLVVGDNHVRIEQTGETPDDIRAGDLRLVDLPRAQVLSEATVRVRVIDRDYGTPLPCRITVLNEDGSLMTPGAESNDRMAVRPGIVYSGDGMPTFGLPAGRYTIYAGRGFEYGIDSFKVSLRAGDSVKARLAIAREVPTPGYISCDTHIHTFTHSRHGDATTEERMLTIAGEGIELPIATDHNLHVDYEETASRLNVRRLFTPVIGNEVTTSIGHFNIFPVRAGAPVPDHKHKDWEPIFEGIQATPDVRAVILNHARDVHAGYRPLGPAHHNAATGRNLDGWDLRANAMELVNSAAQQSDMMQLVRDWMVLLNRGTLLTPVGSSDSHDVGRHFVGQGRTYIRAGDRDPGNIDVGEAVENFVRGRTLVSCGLLTDIVVDGEWGPGDLVPLQGGSGVEVKVRVLGPSWVTADVVELYANGQKIREAKITRGGKPGVKWSGTWKLSDLGHDVHLVAVARGPGIRELYWPIAKPYQPTSPEWTPSVIGVSGAVWLDVDGDGKRTSALDYARRLVTESKEQLPSVFDSLSDYDAAVAAQVAGVLEAKGTSVSALESVASLEQASPASRRGVREFASAWRASQIARRPNVLFITIDDLRNETGCYGKSHVITPNIDRLAERGMRFDRAYVQATFCNPSRVSFLTGLRPDTTGILDNRTWFREKLPDVVTLPQLFRENGYSTMRLGKIFHAGEQMDDPRAWDVARYPGPTPLGRRGEGRNLTGGRVRWCRWLAAEGDDEDQPDGQIAREAVRFLEKKPEKPFFLAVGFHKPHDPFVAPKKYFESYSLDEIELYRDPVDRSPDLRLALGGPWKLEFDKFTDQERKEFLRAYYAGTTFVDAQIGKVLAALEKNGFAENTVVVLVSDHGYHLGERGWWNKSTLFELSARTPLIVYAPSMKAKGKSCSRLVEFVDIYPTLTELCGLRPPGKLEGRSFAPLLDDPTRKWKEAAYTQIQRGRVSGRSVRTERWRYTEWGEGREGVELYDHQSDPGEYRNVAGDPKNAAVVEKMKELLRQRPSDDQARAGGGGANPVAGNEKVAEIMRTFGGKGEVGDRSTPTPPEEALKQFSVHGGFEIELIASEPAIRQPLYMSWDHRGRMWVVQYLQYPFPAGLKVIKYDQYLRAVFDKVPPPPPGHFRGADKITVLEDTDGDGRFDHAKDVITGLNIATAVVVGRGGIWVLNPPYLLFYPDADGDDVPDGDPEVHLSGFGLEDTHSVANSLRWGPDGWLYGANGSTTTGTISSAATKALHFKGQCIWRYQPESHVFEIYAEGGGNTFSLEIDAAGRVFSGTNYGRTHGMHYAQGGYGIKNWGKHGPLTNPYAFGFFQHMRHEGFEERFSQAFSIYDGGAFPESYDHVVIAANALHNRVVASDLYRETSTWRTVDRPPLVTSRDRWFRPVDIKVGPDGAVYLADWYDTRLTHVDPRDNWHKSSGRIYRLRAKGAGRSETFDLSKLTSSRLVDLLVTHANKWTRHEALRVLGDRRDRSVIPELRKIVEADASERTLDALWALHLSGGFTDTVQLRALASRHADVRRWAVRLIGDARRASPEVARSLEALAAGETDPEVRSQLASSARRLAARDALPIVRTLLRNEADLKDLHIPLLLWWAIEEKADSEREAVLAMFEDRDLWSLPMVDEVILERLMQRYAMAGTREDLETCARLLELSPEASSTRRLMSGLEEAFRGRQIGRLPPRLAKALEAHERALGHSDLTLALRQRKKDAVDRALRIVADGSADKSTRLAYIEILGQIREPRSVKTLERLLRTTGMSSIQHVALQALMNYDEPSIPSAILSSYQTTLADEHGVRATAHRVLASRKEWARAFLEDIDRWRIKADTVSLDVVQQMALHNDPEIDALIEKHWGKIRGSTPEEKQKEIDRLRNVIRASAARGDVIRGKALFTERCSKCHTLFEEGGQAGPELTGYERDNLDFLLLAIVDPSAAIREEFTNFLVVTADGRTITGLIDAQDTRTVTLRDVENQTTLVARDEIIQLEALPISLMPENLTAELDDEQVRDLFSYVMSRTPPAP